MGKTGTLLLAIGVLVGAAYAGDGRTLDLKLERAIVFKDGYAMLVKKATGRPDEAGQAVIEDVPKAAVLGAFWAVPVKGKLRSLVARQRILPKAGSSETEKRLVLDFDPATTKDGVEVDVSYFGPGIRWIPTYRIALDNGGPASLSMQAELLNEAEDLEAVPVDLVVGVPNFRFRQVVSPVCLVPSLVNTLQQAAPQIMAFQGRQQALASNVLFSQRAGEVRGRRQPPEAMMEGGVPAIPAELAAEGAHDLFVYHLPKLSLRAGERAIVPVLAAKVPCRHIHTWDVHLAHTGTEALPKVGKHAAPVRLLTNEIWHQIELTNNTEAPWTTGAALIVDGYLPLGQELLTYTSIGGKVQVPITVAIDVRGTYAEEETERVLKALKYHGYDHAKITKKGTLRVTNYKKQPVALYLTCDLGGNALEASDDAKIVITDYQNSDWKNVQGQPGLTGHSTIGWELELKPGETKEVTCTYEYYIRM